MYGVFHTAWATTGHPFCFDADVFTPTPGTPWARHYVRHVDASQETQGRTGQRRFRRTGIAYTQIFVPGEHAESATDELVSLVHNAFEGVSRAGGTNVRFHDVISTESGLEDEGQDSGAWYRVTVAAEFEYDERR